MKNFSSFNQFEKDACLIEVGGVKMTMKQFNAIKKKEQAKKKKERHEKMIQLLGPFIKQMVRSIKVLKSAAAYYDNGPRQWGHVCTDNIINHPYIKGPFIKYRMVAYDIAGLMNDIEGLSKRNEKAIFQFIEKLSYKVDDAKIQLYALVRGVNDSRVCEFYKDERCINETGRRLGLSILMEKALISMSEIEKTIKELDKIATKGIDAFDYDPSSSCKVINY